MENASAMPGSRVAVFFTSVRPPLPFSPAARKVSSGSPACGTSFISIPRCVPTSTTSLSVPRESHSRAMAIAGKSWRPEISRPYSKKVLCALAFAKSFRARLLRNIQEHAGGQQHHQQTRSAIADERQRDAFRRNQAEHDGEVDERLAEDHCRDAEREKTAETIRRGEGSANAAPAVDAEERDDDERADEAKFFADDGVNKISMGFGEIEKFLFALHEADAGEPAGTDRDEGLSELKACALRVAVRMQKGHQAGHAVRCADDEDCKRRNGNGGARCKPTPGKTSDKENGGGDQYDVDRGAEVRLRKDERDTNENRANGRQNVMQKIFFCKFEMRSGFALEVEEPSEIEDNGKLGDFRRLNADGTEANPAMGCVGFVEEKRPDQKEDDDAERAVDNDGLAEFAVVHAHEREHSGDAKDEPDRLAQQEIIRMAVIVFGGDGGCAENHDSTEQTQAKRDSKQPTIAFRTSRHLYLFPDAEWTA